MIKTQKMNRKNKKIKHLTLKKIVLFYLIYSFMFITLFYFLDMYDLFIYNPYILGVLSLLLGGFATYVHLKNREKSRIDDIVDKL